jgi:hypothetical protein
MVTYPNYRTPNSTRLFFSFDYLTEVPLTPFLAAERSGGGAYSRLSSNEVAESGP